MGNNKDLLKILIVGHKESPILRDRIYMPVQAGREIANKKLPFPWVGDNTGENISKKNRTYAELTAAYWALKNLKNVENVGLCHYRRYFYPIRSDWKNRFFKIKRYLMHSLANILPQKISKECCYDPKEIISFSKLNEKKLKIKKNLLKLIKKYDLIIPKEIKMSKRTVLEQYNHYCISEDEKVFREVIRKFYPSDYKYYCKVFNSKRMTIYNMLIARKKIYDEYFNWLFSILFNAEKKIKVTRYKKSGNQRVFAMMAERLFNVWVLKNQKKLKIKRIKVCFLDGLYNPIN